MHSRTLTALIVVVAVAAGSAHAGIPETDPAALGVSAPSTSLLNSGLLDFSRLDIHHSLSYGFSTSSGLGSQSGGLWITEVGYRISDPLRISVDIGAALSTDGGPVLGANSFFLSGFNLDYMPSKNFHMTISLVNPPPNGVPGLHHAPGSLSTLRPWGSIPGSDR